MNGTSLAHQERLMARLLRAIPDRPDADSVAQARLQQLKDRQRDQLCIECGHPLSLGCTLTQCKYPAPGTIRDPRR